MSDDDNAPVDEPEIDDDDIVDVQAVAEEIEEDAATDDENDDDQEANAGSADGGDSIPTDSDRVTPGKVYTNGLGVAGATLRERYGELDSPRKDVADEYAELARDLEVDDAVDDWLAEQGGVDELSPGQAVLVTTLMWGGMVAMDDPDVVGGLADDLGGDQDA